MSSAPRSAPFAGLRGGLFDDIMMRVTDIFLAFPFLVALLVMRNMPRRARRALEPIIGDKSSIRFIILLFALFGWMGVARLVRGQVLALKEREFIEASRAVGASNCRIVVRHLLPNSIGPILVALTLVGRRAPSSPSRRCRFFGFGPQPGAGQTSLGNLVGELDRSARQPGNWWLVVFPCARCSCWSRSASTSSATVCATPLDPSCDAEPVTPMTGARSSRCATSGSRSRR